MVRMRMSRRCVRVKRNWLDLPSELMELLLKKLGLVDIVRLKAVCQFWYKVANSYLLSHPDQSPWLMLPNRVTEDNPESRSWCFINFADQQQKSYKLNMYQWLDDYYYCPRCVGSSFGWFIIFDERSHGCVLNPFTGTKIELPNTSSFKDNDVLVCKAILLSDPSSSSKKSFLLVLYFGLFRKTAFCIHKGDGMYEYDKEGKAWIMFGGIHYADIMYHNKKLYALRYSTIVKLEQDNGMVEVWDFDYYFPKKVATFKPPMPFPMRHLPPLDLFPNSIAEIYSHFYLVESLGEILYVFLESSRTGIGQDINQFVHVYKLDHDGQSWEKVENLRGQALFIGGNQALSVSAREFPEWKENSIYITSYLFHVRVYNLDEKVLKNMVKVSFLPFWIVPHCV